MNLVCGGTTLGLTVVLVAPLSLLESRGSSRGQDSCHCDNRRCRDVHQ